jgi:molybdenum cofactor cytidylyltransferase
VGEYYHAMIPAIVLAAGKSTRMGRTKALLPIAAGETFLARVVRTLRAADVEDVVVVVGHNGDAIIEAFDSTPDSLCFVRNPDYEAGQLTSLLAGLRVIDRPGVVAALVTLVDVPLVSSATVRAVVERYRQSRALIVRPVSGSRHGHPVLIDRRLFDRLRAADPATGAKDVIRAHASTLGDVEVDDEGAFVDVDTQQEYERVIDAIRSERRRDN